uniref:40S ribosomal protein S30 n=1 Tax=Rhabditophanes sp. KR3021 TaxID=114890 RepID=A0AC35U4M7_9BILA
MQLFVSGINGELTTLEVVSSTTVSQIKNQLNAGEFVLSYGSKILDNNTSSIAELSLAHGSVLNINGRLLGGKVHGSLARAGKVRAQTPKVAKAEGKKKKKVGRAFRRIQYNRRFVNVALSGPGRKRGPNSNAV